MKMRAYFIAVLLSLIFFTACNPTSSKTSASFDAQKKWILCFGDSLTRGPGLSEEQSYPGLLSQRISELNLPYQVVNLGVNGETTAGGVTRIDQVLNEYPAEEIRLFILALGGNDGLRQLPLEGTESNLRKILTKLKERKIPTLLVGLKFIDTQAFGRDRFQNLFPDLALEFSVPLVSDLLNSVRLKPHLNQGDLIHPNSEGMKLVFENLWKELKDLLPAS